jgi:hypothetical protein
VSSDEHRGRRAATPTSARTRSSGWSSSAAWGELDLALAEIREVVDFRFDGHCDLMNGRLREAIIANGDEVDRRRDELESLASQFDDVLTRLAAGELRPAEV